MSILTGIPANNLIDATTAQNPPGTPNAMGLKTPKSAYPTIAQSPLVTPPDNSQPWIPNGSIIIPAIGQTLNILLLTIPKGYAGVIIRLANVSQLGSPIAGWNPGDGNLVWKLTRNSNPYQYMPSIVIAFGYTELGVAPLGAPLRIYQDDIIALTVTNVGLAAQGQRLPGLLNGYLFPVGQMPKTSR